MTRVLLWKEIRDQGTVLAALLVIGSAILVAASIVFDSAETRGSVELRSFSAGGLAGLVMLLMTAGVVVGAALFAGEREAGTFGFLDQLPGGSGGR